MNPNRTALERAFEMARSGKFANVSDIKKAVVAEGYAARQLEGKSLAHQLRAITTLYHSPLPSI